MKTAKEIATEYLKEFDRYYLPEQIDELTKEIELYAQEQVKLCTLPHVVFSEAELKAKLDEQKEEHRQWLRAEGYEILAERL